MCADGIEHLSSFLERQAHCVAPLLVEDVEDVVHNRLAAGTAVLQFLKIRATILVQRNNLTIEHKISPAQSLQSEHDLAELRTIVLARHRVEHRGTCLDERDGDIHLA